MTLFFSLIFFLEFSFATDKNPELIIQSQTGDSRIIAFDHNPEDKEGVSRTFKEISEMMAGIQPGRRLIIIVESHGDESTELMHQAKELAKANGAQLAHTSIEKPEKPEVFTRHGVAMRGLAMTGVYLGVVYISNGLTVSLPDVFYSALGGLVSASLGVTAPGYLKFLASERVFGLRKPHEDRAPLFTQLYKDFVPAILLNILMNQLAYQILGTEELTASRLLLVTLAGMATETMYFIGTDIMEDHIKKKLSAQELKHEKVESISAANRLIFALLCTIPQIFECIHAQRFYFNASISLLAVGGAVIFAAPQVVSHGSIKLYNAIGKVFETVQNIQDGFVSTCARSFSFPAARIRRLLQSRSKLQ